MGLGRISTKSNNSPSQIPLTGASIHAVLNDLCAKVKVTQRFHNQTTETQEISYTFDLPKDSAVCSFHANVDGKIVKSELKEKEKAKNDYEDAISSGHGAFLAEKSADGSFKSSIGSLQAGKEVLLELQYVTECKIEGNQVQFSFPANSSVSTSAPQPGFSSRYDGFGEKIKVTVEVEMTSDISNVSSNFSIEQEKVSNKKSKISFSDLGNSFSDQVDVKVTLVSPFEPTFNVEENKEEELFSAVSFHPDQSEAESDDQIYSEMIFLVDCSGSMGGQPIESCKQVLNIFLRSLPQTCFFNIVDFGSSVRSLFPESRQYNDENLKKAVTETAKKDADLGGTDLLQPLQQIFTRPSLKGFSRQIFLLTDGEVDDREGTIAVAAKYAQSTRVFTFGIGSGVDRDLVQRIAKETNGDCEFVPENSKYEDFVMRQLIRAMKPSITDLSFSLEGLNDSKEVKITPFHPPPIFSGDRVLIYFNLPKSLVLKSPQIKATLKGFVGKNEFTQSVHVDLNRVKKVEKKEEGLVSFLYGYSALADLEKRRSYLHTATGELQKGVTEDQVDQQTLKTSLQTGILCSKTAFVAVEVRENAAEGVSNLVELKTTFVKPPSPSPVVDYLEDKQACNRSLSNITLSTSVMNNVAYDMSCLESISAYDHAPPKTSVFSSIGSSLSNVFKLKKKSSPSPSSVSSSSGPVLSRSPLASFGAPPPPAPLLSPAPVSAYEKMEMLSDCREEECEEECDDMSFSYSKECEPSYGSVRSSGDSSSSSNIIACQSASGSYDAKVLSSLGSSLAALQKNLPAGASGSEVEAVLIALFVSLFLEQKRASDQSTWFLSVKKSKNWAKKEATRLNLNFADFEKAASALLSTL